MQEILYSKEDSFSLPNQQTKCFAIQVLQRCRNGTFDPTRSE
jgi:hypothetical protein